MFCSLHLAVYIYGSNHYCNLGDEPYLSIGQITDFHVFDHSGNNATAGQSKSSDAIAESGPRPGPTRVCWLLWEVWKFPFTPYLQKLFLGEFSSLSLVCCF